MGDHDDLLARADDTVHTLTTTTRTTTHTYQETGR